LLKIYNQIIDYVLPVEWLLAEMPRH
jgi:hypothetical protein